MPSNDSEPLPPNNGVHHLHVETVYCNKLYTYNTHRFPTGARSGSQYIMIDYHSSNAIFVQPFASKKDVHPLNAYNITMQRLNANNLLIDLHILDNESARNAEI